MNTDARATPELQEIYLVRNAKGVYQVNHYTLPFNPRNILTRVDIVGKFPTVADLSIYEFFGGANPLEYEFMTEVDDESFFRTEKPLIIRRQDRQQIPFKDAGRLPTQVRDRLIVKPLYGKRPTKQGIINEMSILSGEIEEIVKPSDEIKSMMQFRPTLEVLGLTLESLGKQFTA